MTASRGGGEVLEWKNCSAHDSCVIHDFLSRPCSAPGTFSAAPNDLKSAGDSFPRLQVRGCEVKYGIFRHGAGRGK